ALLKLLEIIISICQMHIRQERNDVLVRGGRKKLKIFCLQFVCVFGKYLKKLRDRSYHMYLVVTGYGDKDIAILFIGRELVIAVCIRFCYEDSIGYHGIGNALALMVYFAPDCCFLKRRNVGYSCKREMMDRLRMFDFL